MSDEDRNEGGETSISRRRALRVIGAIPVVGALGLTQQQQSQGQQQPKQTHEGPNQPATSTRQPPPSQPRRAFFTRAEQRTMRVLADDIIPRDARSGSASEAGAVEFIDFNLSVEETSNDTRTAWRGGLRWLDLESKKRFNVAYAGANQAQRNQILDDISKPADSVSAELRPGAAFFARARDMVAAGFFSSPTGWRDLQYLGNTFVPKWNGCPDAALQKLGVTYDLMNQRTQSNG